MANSDGATGPEPVKIAPLNRSARQGQSGGFNDGHLLEARAQFVSRWRAGLARGISVGRMRNNSIIVQKYGGTCLETPAKIRAVASSLADLHRRGHRVVAMVSSVGKATDEIIKKA